MLQGTLDLLILRTLISGPRHGQGIARAIQETSDEELLVEHRALYPALQRLEERGWISAKWGTSFNNRKARFYTLKKPQSGGDWRKPSAGFWGQNRQEVKPMFGCKRKSDDFIAEIDAHLQLEFERQRELGLSEEEARCRAARLR